MPNVVLPINIDFRTWSAQIQQDLPDLVINLAPRELSGWWDWANQLISVNELADVPIATKTVFPQDEDWRKWAIYFIETLNFI